MSRTTGCIRKAGISVVFVLGLLFVTMPLCGNSMAKTTEIESMQHIELLKAINAARGKIVIVNFFASWCQPCKVEIPGLISLRESLPEDEVLMLGISMDEDRDALQEFAEQVPFNYPIYWGDDNVARVFQVSALPKMLIYNERGGLVLKHDGFISKDDLQKVLDAISKK